MSTIDDLKAKRRRLDDELAEVNRKLVAALLEASPIKVGDMYEKTTYSKRVIRARVVDKTIAFGHVVGVLAVLKKDGSEGLVRSDTSSWQRWKKVEP